MQTMINEKLEVSSLKDGEDISYFIGKDVRLNADQVIVCRENEKPVGCVLIWDGGHSVINVDHLLISEKDSQIRGRITYALLSEVLKYAKSHKAKHIIFVSGEIELTYLMKKRGAAVIGPVYRMLFPVGE